jgi:hypoxanthine phosphoribosyltransferase
MDKKYITWTEVETLVSHLCEHVEASGFKPDVVLGISRGGLIPAVMLSHCWDIPMIPLRWSTRDHLYTDADTVAEIIKEVEDGKRLLIVDDICDSGVTLTELNDHFANMLPKMRDNIKFATLHQRAGSKLVPDFIGGYITDGMWIVYPYEEF